MRAHWPIPLKSTPGALGLFSGLWLLLAGQAHAATLFWMAGPSLTAEQAEALRADVQASLGESTVQALATLPTSAVEGGLYLLPGGSTEPLQKLGLQPLAVLEQAAAVVPPPGWVLLEKVGPAPSGARRLAARSLSSEEREQVQAQVLKPILLGWEHVRVVEVGKGLDVLLALRNGQVELGVVSEAELEQARKVAPPLVQALTVVNRSPGSPLQVLAVPDPSQTLEKYRGLVQKLLTRPVPTGLRWVSRLPLPATAAQPPVAEGKTP